MKTVNSPQPNQHSWLLPISFFLFSLFSLHRLRRPLRCRHLFPIRRFRVSKFRVLMFQFSKFRVLMFRVSKRKKERIRERLDWGSPRDRQVRSVPISRLKNRVSGFWVSKSNFPISVLRFRVSDLLRRWGWLGRDRPCLLASSSGQLWRGTILEKDKFKISVNIGGGAFVNFFSPKYC